MSFVSSHPEKDWIKHLHPDGLNSEYSMWDKCMNASSFVQGGIDCSTFGACFRTSALWCFTAQAPHSAKKEEHVLRTILPCRCSFCPFSFFSSFHNTHDFPPFQLPNAGHLFCVHGPPHGMGHAGWGAWPRNQWRHGIWSYTFTVNTCQYYSCIYWYIHIISYLFSFVLWYYLHVYICIYIINDIIPYIVSQSLRGEPPWRPKRSPGHWFRPGDSGSTPGAQHFTQSFAKFLPIFDSIRLWVPNSSNGQSIHQTGSVDISRQGLKQFEWLQCASLCADWSGLAHAAFGPKVWCQKAKLWKARWNNA